MSKGNDNFAQRSRSAFARAATISCATVLERVEAAPDLTPTQRRDARSALSRLAALAGMELDRIEASATVVREILAEANAARLGVTTKTLANLRSTLAHVMTRFGAVPASSTRRIELSPEWAALLATVPIWQWRSGLNRLAAFCSVMGIAPRDVSAATLVGLHAALEAEEVVKHPRGVLKTTISNWNRCRRKVPGWPDITLATPFREEPWTMPLGAFPESFQADFAAWKRRVRDPDPFAEDEPERALRPQTIRSRLEQIRRLATALVHSGALPIEQITSLAALLEPVHFKAAMRVLLARSGKTSAALHNAATAMRYIAIRYCKFGTDEAAALEQICSRLDPRLPAGMAAKNRERLRQLDDPANVARLLRFPVDQFAKATEDNNKLRAARRAERGLAVALMISCGLRSGTMRALEVGDISWTRANRRGSCHLVVRSEITKAGRPTEYELSPDRVALIELFLDRYRPHLPGADGPFLFPNPNGKPRSKNAFYEAIRKAIEQETGLVLHPHLLRHAVGKIVLERDPGAYLAVSMVLGHKSVNTTMAHYLGTEGRAAARHLDNLLNQAVAEAPAAPRRRRRKSQ